MIIFALTCIFGHASMSQSASRRRAEELAERHRKEAEEATQTVERTINAHAATKAQLEADLAEARRIAESAAESAKLRAAEAVAATKRAEVGDDDFRSVCVRVIISVFVDVFV